MKTSHKATGPKLPAAEERFPDEHVARVAVALAACGLGPAWARSQPQDTALWGPVGDALEKLGAVDMPPAWRRPWSHPRPGFATPAGAWSAAVFFTANGLRASYFRAIADPEDRWLAELTDAMDTLDAEGTDQDAARKILDSQDGAR